jgi:PKD repeat protein
MPTDEGPRPRSAHYAILGVAGVVVATVFAVVASLASRPADRVPPVPDLPGPVIANSTPTVEPPNVTPPVSATTAAVVAPTTTKTTRKTTTTTPPAPPQPDPGSKDPQARFTVSCTGGTCRFDARTSSDSDGAVIYYAWSFGDGTGTEGSRAVSPSHEYQASRTYTVTLLVMDDDGKVGRTSKPVAVDR